MDSAAVSSFKPFQPYKGFTCYLYPVIYLPYDEYRAIFRLLSICFGFPRLSKAPYSFIFIFSKMKKI